MTATKDEVLINHAANLLVETVRARKVIDAHEREIKSIMKDALELTGQTEAVADDGSVITLKSVQSRALRTVNGGRPSDDNPYVIDVTLTKEQIKEFYSFKDGAPRINVKLATNA